MATGGLTPLRGNNAYIGWSKEAAWGTPLAPTSFWRWLDSSAAGIKRKVTTEMEGDTSPHKSLAYTESEYGDLKVVEYVRPRTIGCALQGLMGSGSDSYSAPTATSTLSSGITAGTNSFSTAGSLGNVGASVPFNFTPGVASTTYEVQNVNLASRTGTGPYTYTLAGSATFKFAHSSSDTVNNQSVHTFTRGVTTYDPYCIEVGRGDGVNAPYQVVRYVDAVCYDFTLTSAKGKPLKAEHSWYAASLKLQNANAVPVLEGSNVVGTPGGPLSHFMASGTWSLNNLTTGNALTVEQFQLKMKNTGTAEEFVTESFNPSYFTLDNFDITITLTVVFQNYDDYYMCYFGNTTSPAATAVDSSIVGQGQFSATWGTDGINSLACSVPYCAYTAADPGPPKLDGKPIRQQIQLTPLKSPTNAQPVTLTLSNSQNSQY